MAQLTADWNPLGRDIFYRKFELYSMDWGEQLDLNNFIVAPAAYGGPIALIRDDKKIVKVQGTMGKPFISIFSSAGRSISSIKCNNGKVMHLGWSNAEDLLIVLDDGTVLVYNIFGNFQRTFNLGSEARETKIIDCKIYRSYCGTGVAVVTTSFRFFVVDNVNEPISRRLAEVPGLDTAPKSWTVLSEDRHTEVLLARNDKIFFLERGAAKAKLPEFSCQPVMIVNVVLSFNYKHLALLTEAGILWIGSPDVERRYLEYDTKSTEIPSVLVWCGNSAVVGYWDGLLVVVGFDKNCIKYTVDSPVCLLSELDGVRIIGNFSHEFLHMVPDVVTSIFKIGSMAPSAILLEAYKEFDKKSHRADDYLRTIKDQLEEAITQCMQAAGHEFQPSVQKMLLRAASFGKCFLPGMDPEPFVKMCRFLRVLNAVREYSLAMPLSYTQLEHLTMPTLLDRLIMRQQYCLALRISQFLRIPDMEGASRILSHWAMYKVRNKQSDDDQIAREIHAKVGYTPGVSYSDIANKAAECGRKSLATKLLDYEPRASEQVPLLIKLQEDPQAMSKAIESGDTDLVYTVILHLKDTLNHKLDNFQMKIRDFPVAHSLYLKYCRAQDLEQLNKMYYQEDNCKAIGNIKVIESYKTKNVDNRIETLQEAAKLYRKSRSDFLSSHTEEQVTLLRIQKTLDEECDEGYFGKSLQDTLYRLLLSKNKRAEEIRRAFKVSDKRYCWTKIQVLGELGDWTEIEKISKKPLIGYEPFVDVCVKHHKTYEAMKYLPKVQASNKVKYYVKAGRLDEAVTIALDLKDEHGLNYVLSKCGTANKPLMEKIESMKLQLAAKR